MRGRPVRIKFKTFNGRDVVVVEATARFHCWGYRRTRRPGPEVQETVAVCELAGGEIRLVIPEKVKFLDAQPQSKGTVKL